MKRIIFMIIFIFCIPCIAFADGGGEGEIPWTGILIVIGLALLFAFCMTRYKLSQMNTAVRENYASNYMKDGSFNLEISRDIYLYSHTTRIKRENNSKGH